MNRYFFVIHGPAVFDDEFGTYLQDDNEARTYAKRVIREVRDADKLIDNDWSITVRDGAGREVLSVPFGHVPA